MSQRTSQVSPRIERLQAEIAQGNSSALEAFWHEMKLRGTPLFEPLAGEQDYCLVTFVWRGTEHTRNVVLSGSLASYMDGLEFAARQMDHLAGTDLWYRTYRVHNEISTAYQFSPNDPLLEPKEVADWVERFTSFQPDPFNPVQILYPKDEETPDSYSGICSITQRNAQPPVSSAALERMQTGRLEQFRLHSAILQNERRIWVYTPPGYDMFRAQLYDLLLLLDGFDYVHVITPPSMLDTLLATQQIPPMVAVFIDNLGQGMRNKELPCYQPFIEFLVQELMPWICQHKYVTHDPQRTIISGSSYGGWRQLSRAYRLPTFLATSWRSREHSGGNQTLKRNTSGSSGSLSRLPGYPCASLYKWDNGSRYWLPSGRCVMCCAQEDTPSIITNIMADTTTLHGIQRFHVHYRSWLVAGRSRKA